MIVIWHERGDVPESMSAKWEVQHVPAAIRITRPVTIEQLRKRRAREEDPKVRDRLTLLILVKQGYSARQAAKLLGWFNATAVTWIKRFNRQGYNGLKNRTPPGSPPTIDYRALKKALDASPREYGYDHEAWFPQLVRRYLQDHQQVTISPNYIYVVLKKAGYVLRKPRPRHYRQDPRQVQEFKKNDC